MKAVSPLTGIVLIIIFSIAMAAGLLLFIQFLARPLISALIPEEFPKVPHIPPKEKFPTLEEKVILPQENIITYRLTKEQENYAIAHGKTVLTFEYDADCEPCLERMRYLEKVATQEKDEIILQKILWYQENSTRLKVISYFGEEILRNPSEEEIENTLCRLMITPPIYCVLRGK